MDHVGILLIKLITAENNKIFIKPIINTNNRIYLIDASL